MAKTNNIKDLIASLKEAETKVTPPLNHAVNPYNLPDDLVTGDDDFDEWLSRKITGDD